MVAGETGLLADASDAQGFADNLATLARDAGLRQRMGQAGRARALTFSWDETMARMLGYYKSLLAGAAS